MKRSFSRVLAVLAVVVLLVFQAGCPADPQQPGPDAPAGDPSADGAAMDDPGAARPAPRVEEPPKPTMPKVLLTEAHEATCLVGVGDAMPSGELTGPDGNRYVLGEMLGERLTVVCFWSVGGSERSRMLAESALADLTVDVAAPYAEKGVRVIGVNVGDGPAEVAEAVDAAEAGFPNLLDPQGALFSKVATEGLPRVYLLGADGKILWFDVEYSSSTRHALLTAIQVTLGEV